MKLREGDVFAIPLDGQNIALGQVASRIKGGKSPYLMVVFGGTQSAANPDLDGAVSRPIALQAITFDSLLRVGRWRVLGHRSVPAGRMEWPLFKSMSEPPDKYVVVDHALNVVRAASRDDVRRLPVWTSVGPIRLEEAAKALAGLQAWREDFDVLLPPANSKSGEVRPRQGLVTRLRRR